MSDYGHGAARDAYPGHQDSSPFHSRSAYDGVTFHAHVPRLDSREEPLGREADASSQHTVVQIPFLLEDDAQESHGSGYSRVPLFRREHNSRDSESDSGSSVSGLMHGWTSNAEETDEGFSTDGLSASAVISQEECSDTFDQYAVFAYYTSGDWNTQNSAFASDESSGNNPKRSRRNLNSNARRKKRVSRASDEQPLLTFDEESSTTCYKSKSLKPLIGHTKSNKKKKSSAKVNPSEDSNEVSRNTSPNYDHDHKSGNESDDEDEQKGMKKKKRSSKGLGNKREDVEDQDVKRVKKKNPRHSKRLDGESKDKQKKKRKNKKKESRLFKSADLDAKDFDGKDKSGSMDRQGSRNGGKLSSSKESGKERGDNIEYKKDKEKVKKKGDDKKKKEKKKVLSTCLQSSSQNEYPVSVYFILGSEFCERFTYFGLKTVLVLYLTSWLKLGKNEATAIFHLFSAVAYFTPVIGAILADSYIGRYKTILYISLLYTIGCVILSITALPPPELPGPLIGLLIISIGTGGIKPCVVTFGGDQFKRNQMKEKAKFFSAFYFVINIGGLLSTIATPVLRSDVHCVENSCYPLAFGVPSILMALALIVFYAGHPKYKHVPPRGSIFTKTVKCMMLTSGASNNIHGQKLIRKEGKEETKKKATVDEEKNNAEIGESTYMEQEGETSRDERARLQESIDIFDPKFVKDVMILKRLLRLFLPLPMFWALFNQQGSRWTLQASQLDGRFSFLGSLKPEQMQALNPLLIVILIPVFERFVYPCLKSCKIPHRPLQRMVVGMMFTALAFVFAALLQMKIEDSLEKPVPEGRSGYIIFNTVDCKVQVSGTPTPFFQGQVPPFGQTAYWTVAAGRKRVSAFCPRNLSQSTTEVELLPKKAFRLVIRLYLGKIKILPVEEKREKSTNGTALVSFLHLLSWVNAAQIKISSIDDEVEPVVMQVSLSNASLYHVFETGSYQLSFPAFNIAQSIHGRGWKPVGNPLEMGAGGIYTVALLDSGNTFDYNHVLVKSYVDVKENSLSMMLMVPQYIALTIGEILFAISGLAFAYTQSPSSMKSIIQACWLLTTSVGDLIVVMVAELKVTSTQAEEFWLFAGLMIVDTIVFAVMTLFYKYVHELDPNRSGKRKRKETDWSNEKGENRKGRRRSSTRDDSNDEDKSARKKGKDVRNEKSLNNYLKQKVRKFTSKRQKKVHDKENRKEKSKKKYTYRCKKKNKDKDKVKDKENKDNNKEVTDNERESSSDSSALFTKKKKKKCRLLGRKTTGTSSIEANKNGGKGAVAESKKKRA